MKLIDKTSFHYTEFETQINRNEWFKILQKQSSNNELELVILTETLKTPMVDCYSLNFENLKNYPRKPLNRAEFKFDQILQKREKFLIENVCITSKSSFIVLFFECDVYVIDIESTRVLAKESVSSPRMDANYFLSPTNVNATHLSSLTPVFGRDNVLALTNLKNLVLVAYNSEKNRLQITTVLNQKNEPTHVNSFKVNLNLLIGFSRSENSIVVVDLEKLLQGNKFKLNSENILYEIQMINASILNDYGLSEDNTYAYLIENKKVLRFCNVKTRRELNTIPLYSEATRILCNADFICMSMLDNRVISFLINDPSRPDALERIKALPSRKDNRVNEKKVRMTLEGGMADSIISRDDSKKDKKFYNQVLTLDSCENEKNEAEFKALKKKVVNAAYNQSHLGKLRVSKLSPNWLKSAAKENLNGVELSVDTDTGSKDVPSGSNPDETIRQELIGDLARINATVDLKTYNSGKSVSIVNSLNRSTSKACCIQ